MAYLQGLAADQTVYLSLDGYPSEGILYTAVTVQIKKQGHSSRSTKTLVSADWVEVGNGVYSIVFSPSDMDTVGDFTFTLAGDDFDNFTFGEFTVEPAPLNVTLGPLPQQCIVTGNLATLSAVAPQREPIKIVAYPTQFPAKFSNTILTGDAVWTFADALGNFSLALVQNSVVIIEIQRTGVRAQITIPASDSANLIDLLPPFAIDYTV